MAFRPVMNNRTGELDGSTVVKNIVRKYARKTGISAHVNSLCVHSLRATAATNALDNKADLAKVQKWLGHANVSTTWLYDGAKPDRKTARRFKSGINWQLRRPWHF
jgi:site-specific recombinase XerD